MWIQWESRNEIEKNDNANELVGLKREKEKESERMTRGWEKERVTLTAGKPARIYSIEVQTDPIIRVSLEPTQHLSPSA